jgi:hypothetical protein
LSSNNSDQLHRIELDYRESLHSGFFAQSDGLSVMRTVLGIVLVALVVVSPLAAQEPKNPGCGQWDRESLPEWFTAWFYHHPLAKSHDVACYLNPFYLTGNFDGQGPLDLALLTVAKSSGKRGILIVHRPSLTAHLLGAGTPVGISGRDDYVWSRYWRVESAIPKFVRSGLGNPMPRILGEVLFLKWEGATVWVGWTGHQYVWYQAAGD